MINYSDGLGNTIYTAKFTSNKCTFLNTNCSLYCTFKVNLLSSLMAYKVPSKNISVLGHSFWLLDWSCSVTPLYWVYIFQGRFRLCDWFSLPFWGRGMTICNSMLVHLLEIYSKWVVCNFDIVENSFMSCIYIYIYIYADKYNLRIILVLWSQLE